MRLVTINVPAGVTISVTKGTTDPRIRLSPGQVFTCEWVPAPVFGELYLKSGQLTGRQRTRKLWAKRGRR